MIPQDLDLMTAVVEDATAYLKAKGLLESEEAEFIFSRMIEYSIRGRTSGQIADLIGVKRKRLSERTKVHNMPSPRDIMDLGTGLCVARSCTERRRKLTDTGKAFDIDLHRAGGSLKRAFGIGYRGLRGRAWQELLDDFLVAKWPGYQARDVA